MLNSKWTAKKFQSIVIASALSGPVRTGTQYRHFQI